MKRRNALLPLIALITLLFQGNGLLAEEVATSSPAQAVQGEAIEVAPGLWRKILDNGLEVIVVEDHSLPLLTLEITAHNGAFTETPDFDGLSHLYEHMFFKGNEEVPDQESYLDKQREMGMVWNGTTSKERVNYFFTMTSDHFEDSMIFMRDAIRFPLFDQAELERERIVVLDEFNRSEANPHFFLRRAIDEKLWGPHFSRKNTIGDRKIIAAATPEQMRVVQKRYYVPNNMALFISGDVDHEDAFLLTEELYGDWERAADPFVEHPIPSHPPLKETQVAIVEQDVSSITVSMKWHGPDTAHDRPATYAADVFSFILSQRTSAFKKALVDSGLVLNVWLGYHTLRHTGPISLGFSTTPDKLEAAIRAVDAEIARFTDPKYYSDAQIETAKARLEVDDIYSRESTRGWSHTLSFWWASADLDYYFSYLDNLRRVERVDMDRYVRGYIQSRPRVVGIMLSPKAKKAGAVTEAKVKGWLAAPTKQTGAPISKEAGSKGRFK